MPPRGGSPAVGSPAWQPFSVTVSADGDRATVYLRGELDLSGVEFFGTAGFATLHHVNVICAQHRATWALRVGPELRRFLKICDPDDLLPVEDPVGN